METEEVEEEEEETPLFATSVPSGGLTNALQAVAALIDEDDEQPSSSCRKRKAASLGTAQVHLALATCESLEPRSQRRRNESSYDRSAWRLVAKSTNSPTPSDARLPSRDPSRLESRSQRPLCEDR